MNDDKTLWLDSALDIASEAVSEGRTVEMMRVCRALLRLGTIYEKSREVLEFYANDDNYEDGPACNMYRSNEGYELPKVMSDRGERASDALKLVEIDIMAAQEDQYR